MKECSCARSTSSYSFVARQKTPETTEERDQRSFVVPPLPPIPTLSHFNSDEIHILNGVFAKQKQFDDEEAYLTRFLERDLERYKARMLAKQKEATLTSAARDDDPSLCQLCLKPTHASTSPVICFYCGRRACAWCACYHWPYVVFDKKYKMLICVLIHLLTNRQGASRWLCHLCREVRRIRCRRGSWFHGEAAAPTIGIDWLYGNLVEINIKMDAFRSDASGHQE
ncbi:hypothetical protein LSAT2_002761 [Lamellibrachia satsuma]|nr:hypothetical protein LSAT2_002761 [Lamellibrachia satsuma]